MNNINGNERINDRINKTPKAKRGNNHTVVIIAVVSFVVLISIIALVLVIANQKDDSAGYTMNESNYKEIQEDMADAVAEGYFETYMNTEWTFKDGTSASEDAIFGNSPNNTKPIRFEVYIKDTGEKVYTSDVLPVGTVMEPFKLDKELKKGTYEANCQVYLLNETESGKFENYSDAGFDITITVEN